MTSWQRPRPLEGIRVLDLSRLLPGPFAGLVLADLGAVVDKVEDPRVGDYLREIPPLADGASVAFHAVNRSKRSLAMDLKAPGASDAFKRLISTYDVLLEQFRPGVMDRLGMGHQALLESNPRLIVCALTGYGQSGPLSAKAGHDLNYLARSGLLGLMGPPDRSPQPPSFQAADFGGALFGVIAILGALRQRDRTGEGTVLDIAMTDAVIPFAIAALSGLFGGEVPARGGEVLTGGIAPYDTYATRDGAFMALGALEPKFLERFCVGVGLDFDPMSLRPGSHQPLLKARFAAIFATRTRAEWERCSDEHDCCLEPVLALSEPLADAHLGARGIFIEHASQDGTYYTIRTPVTPRDLEPVPAPRIGEHTDDILRDAGFSEDEILALRDRAIVR
jgi:crotonobetainyl-CoA:carnitine CoA-transferase CaiB-like acyl-CoA transferase